MPKSGIEHTKFFLGHDLEKMENTINEWFRAHDNSEIIARIVNIEPQEAEGEGNWYLVTIFYK